LDNTIINYEKAFQVMLKCEFPELITLERDKNGVKAAIISTYGGDHWTIAQGKLYSIYLKYAEPYDGALLKLHELIDLGYCLNIISHKTKYPISGGSINLRTLSLQWLEDKGFLNPKGGLIDKSNVFFEDTISKKIARIKAQNCEVFIDDLFEILNRIDSDVKKIWMFGNKVSSFDEEISVPATWSEISPSEWNV
jgi:hypothetical protein